MHKRANLLSLEQRRTFQLLHLMFIHKENVDNLRIPERNTRAAQRDQFYVERYNNIKFKNSPFYKGSELWKLLPNDIVLIDSIFQFKQAREDIQLSVIRLHDFYDTFLVFHTNLDV